MVKETFSEGYSACAVAKWFGEERKAIPRWKKALEKLHALSWLESTVNHNQLKRTVDKGREPFDNDIGQLLLDYFKDQRDNGRVVTVRMLCLEAQRQRKNESTRGEVTTTTGSGQQTLR